MVCVRFSCCGFRRFPTCFNLLCWIMVCKRQPPPAVYIPVHVSILVMLDYGLCAFVAAWNAKAKAFQSLLCWITVFVSLIQADRYAELLKLQSCYACWLRSVSITLMTVFSTDWREFQSLLCWIMVCKWCRFPRGAAGHACFNPCYVGLWSVRRGLPGFHGQMMSVSILVMLDYGL